SATPSAPASGLCNGTGPDSGRTRDQSHAGKQRSRLPTAPPAAIAPDAEFGAPVMDIVVWLRSLGIGKYEAAFRENDIDETVLPSLTHQNLKELGVASLGHRVKLLDAIAALRSDASGKTPSADTTTTSSAQAHIPKTAPSAAK